MIPNVFCFCIFSGYVFSAAPHYAMPAMPAPMPVQLPLPFLAADLLRSNGRPNYNLGYSTNPSGDDLPSNASNLFHFIYFVYDFLTFFFSFWIFDYSIWMNTHSER